MSQLSHVRVQLRFQIRTYIYIYVCGRTSSYVCVCLVVRNVGGIKCQPLSKA